MRTLSQLNNLALSDIPAYLGGYRHCRVAHKDHSTNTISEQLISEEDTLLLRNLYHKHTRGLRINGPSSLEKAIFLEHKGLVSKRSGRFYITPKAVNAEYTLIPRIVFADNFYDGD